MGGTAVICAGVAYIFSVELFRGFYLQIVLPEEIYIISEGSIPLKSELFLLFVLGAPPPDLSQAKSPLQPPPPLSVSVLLPENLRTCFEPSV